MNRRKEKPVNCSGYLRYVSQEKKNNETSSTLTKAMRAQCTRTFASSLLYGSGNGGGGCSMVCTTPFNICIEYSHTTIRALWLRVYLLLFHATTIKFRKFFFFQKTASTKSIFYTVYISVVSFTRSLESESMTAFVSRHSTYIRAQTCVFGGYLAKQHTFILYSLS